MGKIKGFMEFDRLNESVINPKERINNYKEFTVAPKEKELQELRDSEMWRAGAAVRSLRPENN